MWIQGTLYSLSKHLFIHIAAYAYIYNFFCFIWNDVTYKTKWQSKNERRLWLIFLVDTVTLSLTMCTCVVMSYPSIRMDLLFIIYNLVKYIGSLCSIPRSFISNTFRNLLRQCITRANFERLNELKLTRARLFGARCVLTWQNMIFLLLCWYVCKLECSNQQYICQLKHYAMKH